MPAMRAPPGYTTQKPLIVQGQSYIGGEWIPGHVVAKATPQERAAIQGQQPQARAQQPPQQPKAAEMFPDRLRGSLSPVKIRAIAPTPQPQPRKPQQPNTGSTATVQVRNVAPEPSRELAGPSVPIVKTAVEAQQVAAQNIHIGQLQTHELQALSNYRKTDQVYKINNYLRGTGGIASKVFGVGMEAKGTAKALDSAIAKCVVKSNLKVMRGFRLEMHADPLKTFKPGSTFTDQGFVSTTLASDVADRFAVSTSQHRIVMEIDVPQGSHGYAMPRAAGEYDEAEVVLPRGAKFAVKSIEKQADGVYRVKCHYTGTQAKNIALSSASQPQRQSGGDRSGRFMWSMGDIAFDHVAMSATLTEQAETVSEHQQAADKLAAQVIERAQAGGVAISKEIRREALRMLRGLLKRNLMPSEFLYHFLREFRQILHRYEPVMARTVSDASLAAWLKGGRGVAELLPELIQPPPEPPRWTQFRMPDDAEPIVRFPIIDEAAADLAARDLLGPGELYTQLVEGRMEGFSIARIASLDALERVRNGLVKALVKGQDFRTWKGRFEDDFKGSKLAPWRMELIFRDALNRSYAAGQKAVVENPLVRTAVAFAWRTEIDDSRLSNLCRHLSTCGIQGTSIFCTDDPQWRRAAPISHHGCRCGTIYLTPERAAQKGIEVAQKWIRDGQRPSDEELFVAPIEIPPALLTPSELAAWEAWVSPWQDGGVRLSAFDPQEPRDAKGQWTSDIAKAKAKFAKLVAAPPALKPDLVYLRELFDEGGTPDGLLAQAKTEDFPFREVFANIDQIQRIMTELAIAHSDGNGDIDGEGAEDYAERVMNEKMYPDLLDQADAAIRAAFAHF